MATMRRSPGVRPVTERTGTLDDLDKAIVVALQQDGRAPWTAIADMCGASGPTVARRGQQLLNDGVLRVAVIPGREADGPVESLLVWITCLAGGQLDVAARLIGRPDIRYLSLVIGEADIVAELVVPKSTGGVAKAVLELQRMERVDRVRADLILHVQKISHDWGQQLLPDDAVAQPSEPAPEYSPGQLGRQDHEMLKVLQDNGRASFKAVAEALGLDASSVRRRFERLRTTGAISVVTLVQAAALGLESETMITIRAVPKDIGAIAAALAERREVRFMAVTSAGNALVCEVIAASTEALYEFITVTLAELDGVLGWDAFMETVTLKRSGLETPWWQWETATSGDPSHHTRSDDVMWPLTNTFTTDSRD